MPFRSSGLIWANSPPLQVFDHAESEFNYSFCRKKIFRAETKIGVSKCAVFDLKCHQELSGEIPNRHNRKEHGRLHRNMEILIFKTIPCARRSGKIKKSLLVPPYVKKFSKKFFFHFFYIFKKMIIFYITVNIKKIFKPL